MSAYFRGYIRALRSQLVGGYPQLLHDRDRLGSSRKQYHLLFLYLLLQKSMRKIYCNRRKLNPAQLGLYLRVINFE